MLSGLGTRPVAWRADLLRRATLSLVFVVSFAATSHAEILSGPATILDGNTLEIDGNRIELFNVDAPDDRQTCTKADGTEWRCGEAVRQALSDWIGGNTVTCQTLNYSSTHEWLGRCSVTGVDVAQWLVARGWAVAQPDCDCSNLRAIGAYAQINGVGLWSSSFALPWEWRAQNAGGDPAALATADVSQ